MIFKFIGPVLGASIVGNLLLFWAWQSASDAVIEEKAACNLSTVLDELEAERIAHEATKRNIKVTIGDLVAIAERERASRNLVDAENEILAARTAFHENTITRLELEAAEDELPDSRACLNAFMLTESVNGLRVSAGDCHQVGGGSRPGAHQACASTQGSDPTAFAGGAFSSITYGDGIRLWQKDRQTIVQLNSQLAGIALLGTETSE